MFGSNKEANSKNKNNSTTQTSNTHSLNSLVQGTVIEGTVRSESDIRIDGTIKGNLHCDAKVIIGPTGHIEGEVTCQNAVIEGTFNGKIKVTALLNIRESAKVSGDVTTDKLIVQSGAVFNVSCHMGVKSTSVHKRRKQSSHHNEQELENANSESRVTASKASQV